MLRSGGGAAPGWKAPQPPLPQQPSSSSFTLSPLAPPFTLDRHIPPKHHPSSPPTSHFSSATPLTSRDVACPSVGIARGGDLANSHNPPYAQSIGTVQPPGSFGDGLEPASGYSGASPDRWIGGLFDGEETGEAKGFGRSSSWVDPYFGYDVSSCPKGVSSENFKTCDDGLDTWHRNYIDTFSTKGSFGSEFPQWTYDVHSANFEEIVTLPHNMSGRTALSTSSSFNEIPYSHPLGTTSFMNSCNAFRPKSSYDMYVAQLESCAANTSAYYPPTTCSTSDQVYAPSFERSDVFASKRAEDFGYSIIKQMDPHKLDNNFSETLQARLHDSVTSNYGESEEGYGERIREYNNVAKNMDSFKVEKSLPPGNESVIGKSGEHSLVLKPGLRIRHLKIHNPLTSCADPDSSVQFSSAEADQHNLAVDSPCWKGASASRRTPLPIGVPTDCDPISEDPIGCGDSNKGENHLPVKVSHLGEDDNQVGVALRKASPPFMSGSCTVSDLMSSQQKINFENRMGLNCAIDQNAEGDVSTGISAEEIYEAGKNHKKDSKTKDDVAQLGQDENTVSTYQGISPTGHAGQKVGLSDEYNDGSPQLSHYATDHIVSTSIPDPSGHVEEPMREPRQLLLNSVHSLSEVLLSSFHNAESALRNDGEMLLKTIYNLSEVLPSSHYDDASELNECDRELLQLVIGNLKKFLHQNEKCTTKAASGPGVVAQSLPKGINLDDTTLGGDTRDHSFMKMMNSLGSSSNADKLVDTAVADLLRAHSMAKALEKALEENFHGNEENTEALVYKNLWIEAEAAKCSMKYELELARMKSEMEISKLQTEGLGAEPHQKTGFTLSSLHDLFNHGGLQNSREILCNDFLASGSNSNKCNFKEPHEELTSDKPKGDEMDATVMARFKVLKARSDMSDVNSLEGQQKFPDLNDSSVELGANDSIFDTDPESKSTATLKETPTKPSDSRFIERNLQQQSKVESRNTISAKNDRTSHFKNSDTRCQELRRQPDMTTIDLLKNIGGAHFFQSALPMSHSKKFHATNGNDSPSSDWEHVQEEEFRWFKSP